MGTFKEWLKEQNKTGLKEAVLNDLDGFDFEEAKGYLNDVVNHGGVSGCIRGLIYYKDTNTFYNDFEKDIEDLLEEFRENCGYKNRAEAIANLNGADSVGNIEQEKNLLAWMGYEETARELLEELESLEFEEETEE